MKFRSYIILILTFLIVLSGVTVTINYAVDPFLIFGSKRVAGFNAIKAAINSHTWLMKTYHPTLGEWDTLLLGNSRVEIGFDPQHRCLAEIGAKAYNLGVPGANVSEQVEFAANVLYDQPIKQIFLSVDFGDFISKVVSAQSAIDADAGAGTNLRYRLDGSEAPGYSWNAVKDRYQALYTFDAMLSSAHTMAMQTNSSPNRDPFGFNPARDFADSVDAEGAQALFAQKIDNLDSKFSAPWRLIDPNNSSSSEFSALESFLEIARDRGIRVTVIASPFHAEYWAILKEHRLYQEHAHWLKLLTEQLTEFDDIVTFWDFTADSEFSQETVPDEEVRSGPLNWYWEPVHFRSQLGDLILETVLSDRCKQAEVHFGTRVL